MSTPIRCCCPMTSDECVAGRGRQLRLAAIGMLAAITLAVVVLGRTSPGDATLVTSAADDAVVAMLGLPGDVEQSRLRAARRVLRQSPSDAGVAANKPAAATDSCFDVDGNLIYAGEDAWAGILDDGAPGVCTEMFPIFSTSRIVAGAPITGDVFKCDLKPVAEAISDGTYGWWSPDAIEQAALEAIFPTGVCDY